MRRLAGWALVLGIVGGVVVLAWLLRDRRRMPTAILEPFREPFGDL